MGSRSRRKGKRGELLACSLLKALGFEASRAPASIAGRRGPCDLLAEKNGRTFEVQVKFARKVPLGLYQRAFEALSEGRAKLLPGRTILLPPAGCPSWAEKARAGAHFLLAKRVGATGSWPWLLIPRREDFEWFESDSQAS